MNLVGSGALVCDGLRIFVMFSQVHVVLVKISLSQEEDETRFAEDEDSGAWWLFSVRRRYPPSNNHGS